MNRRTSGTLRRFTTSQTDATDELQTSTPARTVLGPQRHRYEKFLRGPVPWGWLQRASGLGGKALNVGLALWRQRGISKRSTVKLSMSSLDMGFDRSNASRALRALERAGLVTVERAPGCSPLVTIIDDEAFPEQQATWVQND